MLNHTKNLFVKSNLLLAIAVIVTIAIAYLSLASIDKVVPVVRFTFTDKIGHFIAYFVLSFSWFLAVATTKRIKIIISVLSVFYGMIIEVLQAILTSYRSAEYLDALANTLGVLLSVIIFNIFCKKRKSI